MIISDIKHRWSGAMFNFFTFCKSTQIKGLNKLFKNIKEKKHISFYLFKKN
jgi:hypothetical protein